MRSGFKASSFEPFFATRHRMHQGLLKLTVARQLLAEPSSGYGLVKSIHKRTGWKPSWGSIYPLLERLQHDGLVTVKTIGRSKFYTLTEQGKKVLTEHVAKREQAHRQIIEQLKLLASLGDEECGAIADMLEHAGDERVPLAELPEAAGVRTQMLRLVNEGKIKTHTVTIRAILAKTLKELQKL